LIIRQRYCHAIKYTHDEEAMLAEFSTWREFQGVDLLPTVVKLREFAYHKAYYHWPELGEFRDAWTYGYRVDDSVLRVSLWDIERTADRIVQECGFSCVICGARTSSDRQGRVSDQTLWGVVRNRQKVWGSTAVCRDCAIDIPMVFSPWLTPKWEKRIVDRLIERMGAGLRLQN
jgi:hypothetical protein